MLCLWLPGSIVLVFWHSTLLNRVLCERGISSSTPVIRTWFPKKWKLAGCAFSFSIGCCLEISPPPPTPQQQPCFCFSLATTAANHGRLWFGLPGRDTCAVPFPVDTLRTGNATVFVEIYEVDIYIYIYKNINERKRVAATCVWKKKT